LTPVSTTTATPSGPSSSGPSAPQGKVVTDSPLPPAIQFLCMIRASQINGCGFCTDMHTKDAAHAGETSVRLNLIAAWREAGVFTDAERAALELTEQATRIADAAGGVTRINVITQQPAGNYQPGRWA
jgi:AhpD family alkylhydroperoxidase